jgi:hypothetical protein
LFPMFAGLNMKLQYHYQSKLYGSYAIQKAEKVKAAKGYSDERLEEFFHIKGEKTSKFLLFIVIPVMACVCFLFAFRKTPYFYDHFIFATEVCTFYLLFGYLLLPLMVQLLYSTGLRLFANEGPIGIIMYGMTGLYVGIASSRFFGFRWLKRIVFAVVFSFILALFISHVYKFILFTVVMWLL